MTLRAKATRSFLGLLGEILHRIFIPLQKQSFNKTLLRDLVAPMGAPPLPFLVQSSQASSQLEPTSSLFILVVAASEIQGKVREEPTLFG